MIKEQIFSVYKILVVVAISFEPVLPIFNATIMMDDGCSEGLFSMP